MLLTETTRMALHREKHDSVPGRIPRAIVKGMTYGSLIDYESEKIKKTCAHLTTEAELYSFMKCFGSCQFLRGLWMDLSGEVAHIHIRSDAKNLVSTARTIPSPEQKATIHIISVLRKEACSGKYS